MKKIGLITENTKLSSPTHKDWNNLSDKNKNDEARRMAVYAAMIDCLDQNIGKLIAKLKEQGKFENTLIMFASDNGSSAENVETKFPRNSGQIGDMTYWSSLGRDWANVSNTPLRYNKNDSYQGGICTPFIAHWPKGINNPGTFNRTPTHFIDVLPTVLELSKAKYPETFRNQKITPVQGESLVASMQGDSTSTRKNPIFWQWKSGKAIRQGKWKAVSKSSKWQLFDIEADSCETNDLQEKHPEVFAKMKKQHETWAAQFNKSSGKDKKKK